MSRLYKFLLRFIQYYNVLCGFTYIYVDIENRSIKFSIFVKIYVYFVNLLQTILTIYHHGRLLRNLTNYFSLNQAMDYIYICRYCHHMLIFPLYIWLRHKEEQFLKECLKIFLPLQTDYFDKHSRIPLNKLMPKPQIIYIFMMLINGIYNIYCLLTKPISPYWWQWAAVTEDIVLLLERYIMFNHSFMLSYIIYCFSILNNQLENYQIVKKFSQIYYKLSVLLEQVNIINNPMISL